MYYRDGGQGKTNWDAVRRANEALARADAIPDGIRQLVLDLAEAITSLSEEATWPIDPYLFASLQQGVIRSLRGLELPEKQRKRQIRVGLEQVRQALRDIDEGVPVRADQDVKDVARWLVSALEDVSQSSLAEVLGIDPRTLQRWISEDDPASPRGDQALRLRVTARLVKRWFLSTQPKLGRKNSCEP